MFTSGVNNAYSMQTLTPKNKAKLTCIHHGYPLQLVTMDILGPLPESANKNSYVLVVSDYFTRWTEAYALPNREAKTVAHKLVEEFFFRFSILEQLHSDLGRQFESTIIKKVNSLLQMKRLLLLLTAYNPTAWWNDLTIPCSILATAIAGIGRQPVSTELCIQN